MNIYCVKGVAAYLVCDNKWIFKMHGAMIKKKINWA
jgi:hypothetical protein